MQIENRFELPLAPEAAWPLLMDVPRTAAAFPGASDIEVSLRDAVQVDAPFQIPQLDIDSQIVLPLLLDVLSDLLVAVVGVVEDGDLGEARSAGEAGVGEKLLAPAGTRE